MKRKPLFESKAAKARRYRACRYLAHPSNEVLLAMLGQDRERLNAKALGQALGAWRCKVWRYITGRNKWPADDWLKAMFALGLISEGRDCYILRIPKTRQVNRMCDTMKDAPVWKTPPEEPPLPVVLPDIEPPSWANKLREFSDD